MINSHYLSPSPASEEERVETIVQSGAKGALTLAGIATFVVILIWFLFYLLVFIPRAPAP